MRANQPMTDEQLREAVDAVGNVAVVSTAGPFLDHREIHSGTFDFF